MARAKVEENKIGIYHTPSRAEKPWKVVIRGPWVEHQGKTLLSRSFPDKASADEWATAMGVEINRTVTGNVTIGRAVNAFVEHLTLRGKAIEGRPVKESTVQSAKAILRPFSGEYGDWKVGTVRETHVVEWVRRYTSRASQFSVWQQLKRFFAWLEDMGAVASNPAKKVVLTGEESTRHRDVLTPQEAEKFVKKAMELWQRGTLRRTARDREHALIGLLYLLGGARAGEMLSLRVRDLYLEPDDPLITIQEGKTEAAARDLELNEPLRLMLLDWTHGRTPLDWVFPSTKAKKQPRTRTFALKAVKEICRQAGIPEFGPQAMRRSHARLDRKRGTGIRRIGDQLGHGQDTKVTTRNYIGERTESAVGGRQVRDMANRWMGTGAKPPVPEDA